MREREQSIPGLVTQEVQVEAAGPGEKRLYRRRRQRANEFFIGEGTIPFLPLQRDLANPELFLELKKSVLGKEIWRKIHKNLPELLPRIVVGSEVAIIGYRYKMQYRGQEGYYFRYYIQADQAETLRDLFEQKRQLIEEKKRSEPKKGPHPLSRLKPEDIDGIVGKLTDGYATDEPIFYRSDSDPKFKEIFPFSRQTLNDILTIAQKNGVIAVPYREKLQSGRAFYSREEIVDALEHFGKLRQRGEALSSTAKRLRVKACEQEAAKFTLKEAAEKLNIPTIVLYSWIIEGRVDLGNSLLFEEIRRRSRQELYRRRLFDSALTEDRSIRLQVDRYQESLGGLDGLTRAKFKRYRELFSTISETARQAGLHVRVTRIAEIAQILKQHGIKIVDFPNKNAQGEVLSTYYVLAKKDKRKAVRILRTNPNFQEFCQNPVQWICGPRVDPLPTTTQLFNRQKYLRPGAYLRREFAIEIGRNSGITVASFFGPESPVSIIKYRTKNCYFFPREQELIAREFVEAKKQIQSSVQERVS